MKLSSSSSSGPGVKSSLSLPDIRVGVGNEVVIFVLLRARREVFTVAAGYPRLASFLPSLRLALLPSFDLLAGRHLLITIHELHLVRAVVGVDHLPRSRAAAGRPTLLLLLLLLLLFFLVGLRLLLGILAGRARFLRHLLGRRHLIVFCLVVHLFVLCCVC